MFLQVAGGVLIKRKSMELITASVQFLAARKRWCAAKEGDKKKNIRVKNTAGIIYVRFLMNLNF